MSFSSVSVVGLGYIGLPTAAMFASRKFEVIGVDVNQRAVDTINRGEIHIVEPDLDIAVHAAVTEGYLKAVTEPRPADAFIIAVPTPFKDGHKADLSYIEAAAKAIAPHLQKGNLVILESTSPVGATEKMAEWLASERSDLSFPQHDPQNPDINISHCPERVLPGQVMRELISNDRIIGGMTQACSARSVELYRSFVKGECITTDARTAELAKLVENSFRDVNIAFANELSMICDKLDINVWELIALANRHPRVNILNPGCGVGGHCIAVDPWFIVDTVPEEAQLIHQARLVNDKKPVWVVKDIVKKANELDTRKIVCLGVTFKPDIDDMRESPALNITQELLSLGYQVEIVEPNIAELPASLSDAELVSLDDALMLTDRLYVTLVAHQPFVACRQALQDSGRVLDYCGAFK